MVAGSAQQTHLQEQRQELQRRQEELEILLQQRSNKKEEERQASVAATAVLNEVMEALLLTPTTAAATSAATTTVSDIGPCFHGSTSDHFSDGRAYTDIIRDYISVPHNAGGRLKFCEDHKEYCIDLNFSQYIFALCTSLYLKTNQQTDDMHHLLYMAIHIKYHLVVIDALRSGGPAPDRDKLHRYDRGISNKNDDRGVINCLSRETRPFCDCMKDKKTEADGMPKVGTCTGCLHSFPRSGMKKCSGCKCAMFCTTEGCYDKYWPAHRETCQRMKKIRKRGNKARRALREFDKDEEL